MTNPTPHGCTIGGQPAMPILISEYNQLTADLAALRAVARGYCPACGRGDAAPTVTDWEQQRQRADQAETAVARIAGLADEYPVAIDTALIHAALDQPAHGPAQAATEATDDPELTADEARDLVDQLGLDLYRAQDTLAYVSEWCDLVDREQRPITTADVREWLKGDRCARQRAADATPCRCHQEPS